MHLFVATDLTSARADRLEPDEDESIQLVPMAWQDALAAADRGEIADAKSLVGLLWLARMGGPEAVGGG
jgi:8-oxo-dGTP pyrophosphatase MutT (NUDIX family)